MMLELVAGMENCFHWDPFILNSTLASFNAVLAIAAFSQLFRIHTRNRQSRWTRQKVLHLIIGSSNLGYFVYFISSLLSTCKLWHCLYHACGFILMVFPKILFLSAFLLLLSFWVDLCHQASDEEEEDDENSIQCSLLKNLKKNHVSSDREGNRKCCTFRGIHLGIRQKFVIMVVIFAFLSMMAFSLLIWIGGGNNPIDSSVVARVYEDFLALTVLLLGGALGCYGLLLYYRLRRVRSEKASSEMKKVAGVAVVSVVCFTSSALVNLLTNIPLLYFSYPNQITGAKALLLAIYFLTGSLVPSAFVLWIIRELPPQKKVETEEQSKEITSTTYNAPVVHHHHQPQRWTNATSSKNQASRASPI